MLFEKVFQRDDKSFLLFYHLFLSGVLYFSSTIAYYIRNKSWELTDTYIQSSAIIAGVLIQKKKDILKEQFNGLELNYYYSSKHLLL